MLKLVRVAVFNGSLLNSCRYVCFARSLGLLLTLLWPLTSARATMIAEYDFTNDGLHVHDSAPASPNYDLDQQPNGTAYASANLYGTTAIGNRLGQAGLMTEPTEPTTQDNNYGFWAPKQLLMPLTNWTTLIWFNRQDAANVDMLFYVGTGDGFSGTGPETYVFLDSSGHLDAQNYRTNSTLDWNASGGTTAPTEWHQAGIVRSGSSMSLYLDGVLINTTGNVSLTSFDSSSNSVIVFGAAKWMLQAYQRARVFDGLLDQIEGYDQALTGTEILGRYQAFAVPEPTTLSLLAIAAGTILLRQMSCRCVSTRQESSLAKCPRPSLCHLDAVNGCKKPSFAGNLARKT